MQATVCGKELHALSVSTSTRSPTLKHSEPCTFGNLMEALKCRHDQSPVSLPFLEDGG